MEIPKIIPAGLTILVVDDDSIVREVCLRVLESQGNRVALAESVDGALKHLESQPFDAIVCDYGIPGKNGVTFYNILKEQRRAEAWHFVMMTGLPSYDIDAKVRILTKPFSSDQLSQAIADVTGR